MNGRWYQVRMILRSKFGVRRLVDVCKHFAVIPGRFILSRCHPTPHSSHRDPQTTPYGSGAFILPMLPKIHVYTHSMAILISFVPSRFRPTLRSSFLDLTTHLYGSGVFILQA